MGGDQLFVGFVREGAALPEMEAVHIGVTEEAAQEALARRMAAHEALPGGAVAVGMDVDGGVAHAAGLAV